MTEIQLQEIDCPLCGSPDNRRVCQIVDATYGISGRYQVVECSSCKHIYLNPRPTDESLLDCYPSEYAPHIGQSVERVVAPECVSAPGKSSDASQLDSGTSTSAENAGAARRLFRAIPGLRGLLYWLGRENATHLPDAPNPGQSRLLEIGCAHGGFLEQAAAKGWVVDGVEPSEAAAKSAAAKGFDVYCGLLEGAKIESESRDMVAMWMVLEHVPNPVQVVNEVLRVLRPGGTFTFSVPNASTWERWVFGSHWLGYDAPRHLQIFSARRVKRLLSDQGFTDIKFVHQANTRYWWGSIAAWGKQRFPSHHWPDRWMRYFTTEPPSLWRWCLLLPGKLVEVTRCSGRITVIARKPL